MSFFGKAVEHIMTENISRHKRKRLIIFITVITLPLWLPQRLRDSA